VGLYDALFLTHPAAAHFGPRDRARVAAFAQACLELPPASERIAVLARHTLLANLFRIARTDRHVGFWVGARDFRGCEPPRRLVRWPNVRRVQVEARRIHWVPDGGIDATVRKLVTSVLACSPLSRLVADAPRGWPIDLGAVAPYLADLEVARYAAYAQLSL